MKRIVISEFMDAEAVDALRGSFDVVYDAGLVDDATRLGEALRGAEALIVRNRTRVDAELLGHGTGLRVVGRLGVGMDNIDLEACRARDIEVIPATGANARAVAEYVVCTGMMLLRGAYRSSAQVAAGEWPRAALSSGRELAGKTLGLVGFGGIGRLTAELARAWGMNVLAHDPFASADDTPLVGLDALLREADVVSLHIPLNADTRGLFSHERLAAMKPGAVLVNTARGGIVDEAALGALLREGRLGGAALDVYENEPLPAGGPLADAPNLILTPHIAGVTAESNQRVSAMIAERVAAQLSA